MKSDIHSKAEETVLILDRINSSQRITRDKEGYFTMVEGSIHQEGKTLVCVQLITVLQMHEAHIDRIKGRHTQYHNQRWRFHQ